MKLGLSHFSPATAGGFDLGLLIYTIVFFVIVGCLSLNPSKIVDRVGKIMTPVLLIAILILLVAAFVNPIDKAMAPIGDYIDNSFFKGFQEGYLTMDTLASLVFGIIVINAIKAKGITIRSILPLLLLKTGVIAAFCLGFIYLGLGYLGNTANFAVGEAKQWSCNLNGASAAYFGVYGNIILGLAIIFACLTTAIGLITSCASYFQTIFPRFTYKQLAIIFTIFSAAIANIGLSQLITISVPVLVAIYPIAIVLIFLTFAEPL